VSQLTPSNAYGAAAYGAQPFGAVPAVAPTYARPFSKAAEWYLTFCLTSLLLEGFFYLWLNAGLSEKSIWIARITPYSLWPSVLWFYSVGFCITLGLVFLGRQPWHPHYYGKLAFVGLWMVYVPWSVYGMLQRNIAWLGDLRGLILPSMVVPGMVVLAQYVRLDKIATRMIKISIPFAIVNVIRGAMFFGSHGELDEGGLMEPSWRSEYIMLAMYCLAFARSVTSGKKSTGALIILALGIVAPLHKPVLATFVGSHVFLLFFALRAGRKLKSVRLGNTVLVLVLLGGMGIVAGPMLLNLGGGFAKDYLLTRIFKYGANVYQRDTTGGRIKIWTWCLEEWTKHPLVGVGLGERVIKERKGELGAVPIHNLYIQTFSQTGLIGFGIVSLAVLSWAFRVLRTLASENNESRLWPRIGLCGFVFSMLLSVCYGDTLSVRCLGFMFWTFVGLETGAHCQTLQETRS
jgi:O-antigen ligase